LKETDSRYTELKDTISGLKAKNQELKKAITGLDQAKGKCPVCNRSLTERHKTKLLKEYNTSKTSNDQRIQELKLQAKDLELKKKELSHMRESINKIPVDLLESKSKTIQEKTEDIKKQTIEKNQTSERSWIC